MNKIIDTNHKTDKCTNKFPSPEARG